MKPDLVGRTVLGLQPRFKALSETFRDNSSDFAILGPDPLPRAVQPAPLLVRVGAIPSRPR
eukprot:5531418-Prymnesium_polylepis.1